MVATEANRETSAAQYTGSHIHLWYRIGKHKGCPHRVLLPAPFHLSLRLLSHTSGLGLRSLHVDSHGYWNTAHMSATRIEAASSHRHLHIMHTWQLCMCLRASHCLQGYYQNFLHVLRPCVYCCIETNEVVVISVFRWKPPKQPGKPLELNTRIRPYSYTSTSSLIHPPTAVV